MGRLQRCHFRWKSGRKNARCEATTVITQSHLSFLAFFLSVFLFFLLCSFIHLTRSHRPLSLSLFFSFSVALRLRPRSPTDVCKKFLRGPTPSHLLPPSKTHVRAHTMFLLHTPARHYHSPRHSSTYIHCSPIAASPETLFRR